MKKVYKTPILKMESFEMDFDIMLESIVPDSVLWNQFKDAYISAVAGSSARYTADDAGFRNYLLDMGYDDGNSGFCVYTEASPS